MDKRETLAAAQKLADEGAFRDAHRLLMQLLAADRDDEEVLWAMTRTWEREKKPPPAARYRARIADLHAARGDVDTALALYREALALLGGEENGDAPGYRLRIAELQERVGQADEARRLRWLAGEDVGLDEVPTLEMLQTRHSTRWSDGPLRLQLAEALLAAGRVREAIPHFRECAGGQYVHPRSPPPPDSPGGPSERNPRFIELPGATRRYALEKMRTLIEAELAPGLEGVHQIIPTWGSDSSSGETRLVYEVGPILERLLNAIRWNFDLGSLALLDRFKQEAAAAGGDRPEVELRVSIATAIDWFTDAGVSLHCPKCARTWPREAITVENVDIPGNAGFTTVTCEGGHELFDYQRWIA